MPNHEQVTCPRCTASFECKMGSILLCHCSSVPLDEARRAYIAERWESCLCQRCLLEIQAMDISAADPPGEQAGP